MLLKEPGAPLTYRPFLKRSLMRPRGNVLMVDQMQGSIFVVVWLFKTTKIPYGQPKVKSWLSEGQPLLLGNDKKALFLSDSRLSAF